MKTLVYSLCIIFGITFVAGIGLVLYGKTLPFEHHEEITAELNTSSKKVWQILTDYKDMPTWWSAVVKTVDEKQPDGKTVTWNYDQHGKRIGFVTVKQENEKLLVREIVTKGLPFGGSWSFELTPLSSNKTKLTLIEDGFIRPALARIVMIHFIGIRSNMESFIDALKKKINQ